ncbi:YdeI/OmpD-associated family protein [Frigoribacterium sp. 2-23]|uniref:YdeI/OmpD-associated family protein n=1 Tax=Frigoribacterium sp. 2-23 TaxID=3415006 RepID=UPI003C700401
MASIADKPIVRFTVEQWQQYLDEHAATDVVGVRLTLRKKNSTADGMTWSEALDVALCHGWIDGQSARLDDDYLLTAFQPRRSASPWSQVNREHVARLIAEGRMLPRGLAEVERARADGRWDAAYRQKGAVAPPDLEEALAANADALAFWQTLTKTERFRVYFRLAAIKTPAVRAARIRDVVEKAARGERHYR